MRSIAAGGLVLVLASCSSVSVSQDYDPAAPLATLRTYAWFDGGPKESGDPLTAQRIVRALEAELPLRGLVKEPAASADVHVNFQTAVRRKVDVTPSTVSVGYGWRHGTVGMSTADSVSVYDEGTLVVDFISPKTKTLVWRGTARAVVDPDRSPEEREARIHEAVRKLLAQFPPAR